MRWLLWLLLLQLGLPARAQLLRGVVGENQTYRVNPGDDLYTVSYGAGLAMEHLAFANALPIQLELQPDQELLVPGRRLLPQNPPRDGLVLNLPERGMYLFRHGQFVKFYPVAIGRPGFHTPRGQFRIIEKTKNPTWVPPRWAEVRKAIGPGGNNPLGDRWIGLSSPRLGIHGTKSPYSIGDTISHGCLRMYPEMVRELFDQVRIGMPVRIEYETVKLGRDQPTGELLLAAFPDVYGLSDPYQRARTLLAKVGVRMTATQLRQVLGKPSGIARSISELSGSTGISTVP